MAFCPKCGSEINENDRYCYNCGNPINNHQSAIVQGNTNHSREMTQRGASPLQKASAVALFVASILYSFVLPVDVLPDVVPVIGWIDDAGLLLVSTLNMIQAYIKNQNSFMVHIIKILKWILFVLFAILALLFGGLIAFIVSLFKK